MHLHVDSTVKPVYLKSRSIPYAMKSKVDAELDRLLQEGILEPVPFSTWAAPIVPVLKSDKSSIRICGDFRVTVNKAVKLDSYPIHRVEDLFAKLSGGKRFTKLDLSQACQQLELDEESKEYVVINTPRGFFSVQSLAFWYISCSRYFSENLEITVARDQELCCLPG